MHKLCRPYPRRYTRTLCSVSLHRHYSNHSLYCSQILLYPIPARMSVNHHHFILVQALQRTPNPSYPHNNPNLNLDHVNLSKGSTNVTLLTEISWRHFKYEYLRSSIDKLWRRFFYNLYLTEWKQGYFDLVNFYFFFIKWALSFRLVSSKSSSWLSVFSWILIVIDLTILAHFKNHLCRMYVCVVGNVYASLRSVHYTTTII